MLSRKAVNLAPVLSAFDLHKSYDGNEVVAGINIAIMPGECFGLLGPNGAGKTTTLRLCLGLTEPDAGKIDLLGYPVPQDARRARQRVGVVPQFDNLDPDFSVRENLLVYGRYFDLPESEIAQRIPALLKFAGLDNRENARILALSGGMKRRLTLARALINNPDLLFLDEPTTGLDPQARHLIWERLKRLMSQGKTIILTTHFMEEAERLCHNLSIMDHGRIIATGTPRELIIRNIEPEVVEVYGENLEEWIIHAGPDLCERYELSGETAFCYTRHPQALISSLQSQDGLRYLHRPANLEDVFLKLTGRDIRD